MLAPCAAVADTGRGAFLHAGRGAASTLRCMNFKLQTATLLACLALGGSAWAATARHQPMGKAAYEAEKTRIAGQALRSALACPAIRVFSAS